VGNHTTVVVKQKPLVFIVDFMGDVISGQNALIVTTVMMQYGAVRVPEDHFDMFPLFLNSGCPIVVAGMAPYRWWEQPPQAKATAKPRGKRCYRTVVNSHGAIDRRDDHGSQVKRRGQPISS
jgi:glucose-6-phosphate dehydrogenase assembly protein OpcA